jgi:tRNA threonylcarbamoyladenosine biosynthesis protein TsaB
LVSEWTLDVQAQHSERLLWGIHQCLEAARWKLDEVDLLGVGVGPGSFTGLRIGITTARTLSWTLGKPLIGISSLAALARPIARFHAVTGRPTLVIAATDACKGELFALHGLARSVRDCVVKAEGDQPGLWKNGVQEGVWGPDALARELRARFARLARTNEHAAWVVVGDGRVRYPELWKGLPRDRELEPGLDFSTQLLGRAVGILAWEAQQAGLARPGAQVSPRYLRAPDAELKLRAGLLQRNAPTRGEGWDP